MSKTQVSPSAAVERGVDGQGEGRARDADDRNDGEQSADDYLECQPPGGGVERVARLGHRTQGHEVTEVDVVGTDR